MTLSGSLFPFFSQMESEGNLSESIQMVRKSHNLCYPDDDDDEDDVGGDDDDEDDEYVGPDAIYYARRLVSSSNNTSPLG